MGADFRDALRNYYGGLIGIAVYLVVTAGVSFAAFMAAFGNPTPAAEALLDLAAIYFTVARPLWMIPIAYFLGGLFIRKK
ncbi:MAG TPA: hypothetical protein ENN85_09970 [Methanoculleus sp.]|nr:hypothetical protein [Methanoculleus sp.]